MRRLSLLCVLLLPLTAFAQALPGTKPLEMKGDLARHMLDGIDRALTRATSASIAQRKEHWHLDYSSHEAYAKSVAPNRERLKKIIGVVDPRLPVKQVEHVGGTAQGATVAITDLYTVVAVRWPVLPGVYGEGLLLEPRGKPRAAVVAIPDADQTPEVLVGLAPGLPAAAQLRATWPSRAVALSFPR